MKNREIFLEELDKAMCLCQDSGNLTDKGYKYLIEKIKKILKTIDNK